MNRNRRVGLGTPAPTGVEKGMGTPAPTGVKEKESCYLV